MGKNFIYIIDPAFFSQLLKSDHLKKWEQIYFSPDYTTWRSTVTRTYHLDGNTTSSHSFMASSTRALF